MMQVAKNESINRDERSEMKALTFFQVLRTGLAIRFEINIQKSMGFHRQETFSVGERQMYFYPLWRMSTDTLTRAM